MPSRRPRPTAPAALLAAALSVTLAGGCCLLSRTPPRECVSKKGCPPKRPLNRCGANVTAIARPLKDVLSGAKALVGRTVTVRSRLRREGGVCTMLLCAPGTCCNGCGAFFVLTTAGKPDRSHPHTLTLMNTGKGPHPHDKLACYGDDSGMCCTIATGREVVVTGKLVKVGSSIYGPNYALHNPRICLP